MEKQEGLAEYTGVFIALRETGENISREARVVEAFEDSNSFARSFGYAVGPALGLLLDRYANGWRERADLSASLDSMLISSLHVQAPKDPERVVKLRAALYGYSAVATAERARGTSPSFLARADSQVFGEADTGFPDCARNEPKF